MSKKDRKPIDQTMEITGDCEAHVTTYYDDGSTEEYDTYDYEEIYGEPEPEGVGESYKDEFSVLGGLGAWLKGEYD